MKRRVTKFKIISFLLNFPESSNKRIQIGKTINAGNHFDKTARPMDMPARMLYEFFFVSTNFMDNNTDKEMKTRKKISM